MAGMTGSVPIYNLPEGYQLSSEDYIPFSSTDYTQKISGENLRKYLDKTTILPTTSSLSSDDFIKVDGLTYGTRKLSAKSSLLYSVSTGVSASASEIVLGNDPRLSNSRAPTPHTQSIATITDFNPSDYVLSSSKGQPNGVVPLNSSGKISQQYLVIGDVPIASQITSSVSNLITAKNVQAAINQLSSAQFIFINSSSAGVVGTVNVQGALGQKLSLSGGTLTGKLNLPSDGLTVGVGQISTKNGRVGLGTLNPLFALDVAGTIRTTDPYILITNNDYPQLVLANVDTVTKRFAIWRDPNDILYIGSQTTSGGGSTNNSIGILRNGNVGIGNVPQYKLDVAGTIRTTNSYIMITNNNYPQLVLADGNTTTRRFSMWVNPSDVMSIGPQFPDGTGVDNTSINITRSGRVGVGTISPSSKLHVVGEGGSNKDTVIVTSTNGALTEYSYWPDSWGGGIRTWDILCQSLIAVSGIFCKGDIVAFQSSDRNLKENIENIKNPIEKIKKINGVSFEWNDKQSSHVGRDIGVIAQEIENVLPEIVTTRDNGYKAVKYEKIVALLIEGIKDLQNQIDELKRG